MNQTKVFSERGGFEILNNVKLSIDDKIFKVPISEESGRQFNIRYIIEHGVETTSSLAETLGKKISEENFGTHKLEFSSKIKVLTPNDEFELVFDNDFGNGAYTVEIACYLNEPLNGYGVLQAIPLPVDILNIHFRLIPLEG